MRRTLLVLGVVLAMAALAVAANTGLRVSGWTPADEAAAARTARLAENWRVVRPEGRGRLRRWRSCCRAATDRTTTWTFGRGRSPRPAGRRSILDSHAPRGLDRWERWRLVCSGQLLAGAERAGDVAAVMAALGDMEGVDASRVLLLGASHGGWAVAELMALAEAGTDPAGL